jgi:NTE family protein
MSESRTALILTGGGARAGYQVGVLKAIRELLHEPQRNPFPILCGTSAGALNAASLAVAAEDFGAGVAGLVRVWENFNAHQVYRADPAGIGVSGARWLSALALGWLTRRAPRSLLDNAPLRQLLGDSLDFSRIGRAIESGALHSISITCSGYSSGQSVSFFQGRAGIEPWRRSQRVGAPRRDFARSSDGIERHPLHFSGRASQPGMVRRWLDAASRARFAGDPPRRAKDTGDRRRPPG